MATYAIDLGALVLGDESVPIVYRDPKRFFGATHPTREIRRLIVEVASRLAGKEGDRVIQLRSPFGGGKSHTLAALFHAINTPESVVSVPELRGLPEFGKAAIAVFDGEKFDALSGKNLGANKTALTMWGWLAWQISTGRKSPETFKIVSEHDKQRTAPGGDRVAEMLQGGPGL